MSPAKLKVVEGGAARHATQEPDGARGTSGASAPSPARSTREPDGPVRPPAPDPAEHEARRVRVWQRVDQQAKSLEVLWERQLRAFFAQQQEATLNRLEGKRGRQATRETRAPDPGRIFDLGYWRDRLRDLTQGLLETVFTVGSARVAEKFPDVDIAFDVTAPYAAQFISERANQLAGHVTDTTYRQIQDALGDGLAAGESVDQIASRVRAVFTQASETRAATIARTETIGGLNASTDLAAAQLPRDVAAGREWIATPDHRTRHDHRDADGQVQPMGMPFTVGGYLMPYPGFPGAPPAQTINCRCTLAILTPGELATRQRLEAERRWTPEQAVRVLALVEARVIDPDAVPKALAAVG